jgi:mannose-6-phosphate isomerase
LTTATGFGITLRQLMIEERACLLGAAAGRFDVFPWLIKFLDAQDWLSVQVHPDEATARRLLPAESAKTEAWYVLDAEPNSRVYAGLKPDVGPAEVRAALAQGTVADCLGSFEPKPGDLIFLPAGTVHAVGGGVLLAEIQQTSDATFRLFDWNRRDAQGKPRPLHIDEAFEAIHWSQGLIQPIAATDDDRQPLIACPYFEIERIHWPTATTMGGSGRLQALVITAGHGRLDNGEFAMAGDVWILPAALPPTELAIEAPLSGLLCTLPEGGVA